MLVVASLALILVPFTISLVDVEAGQPVYGNQPIPGQIIYTEVDQYLLMTIGSSIPYTGFISDDVDGDGTSELIFGTQDGRLIVYDVLERRELLNLQLTTKKVFSVCAGNVDIDPSRELIVATGDAEVLIIDYASKTTQLTISDHPTSEPITLYDPEGDGVEDLVYISDYDLVRLMGTGAKLYNESLKDQTKKIAPRLDIIIGDVDNDSRDEMFISDSGSGTFSGRNYWVFDAATGQLESYKSVDDAIFESAPILVHQNGSPLIVIGCYQRTGTGRGSYDLAIIDLIMDDVELLQLYMTNEFLGWRFLTYYEHNDSTIILMCSRYGDLIAWDMDGEKSLWEVDGESHNRIRETPIACDIDYDGSDEIIVPIGGIVILDSNNGDMEKEIEVTNYTKKELNLLVDDVDGDGYSEICYGYQDIYGTGDNHISLFDSIYPNKLLFEEGPTVYAGYKRYDFIIEGGGGRYGTLPNGLTIVLDPGGADVRIKWVRDENGSTLSVTEGSDYIDLITTADDVVEDRDNRTVTVPLGVMFDWDWPHEEMCSINIKGSFPGGGSGPDTSVGGVFRVENDLDLRGLLIASGEHQGPIGEGEWVRAGERVTVTGPVVVYEGTDYVYPPSEVVTPALHDDDGDNTRGSHARGAPINLTISADDTTDQDEMLTLTLEDLPGTARLVSEPSFGLRVDGDLPTFRNAIPGPDDWHSRDVVLVSITADDTNTSGVDGATLEYQWSTAGVGHYGDWTREGLSTTADGPVVDGLVSVVLANGDDNYVRWRVKDRVGNGYAVSGDLRIKVDTRNMTYTDPIPTDWQMMQEVLCGVTINDVEGSGIDVSSIQYRSSVNNLSRYSHWKDWDEGDAIDATSTSTSVLLELAEGRNNYVQWRAIDIAGNGYTTSPHYRILVDITPISFRDFTPDAGMYQSDLPVRCTIMVLDNTDGSGIDMGTLECRYKVDGGEYSPWSPVDADGILLETMVNVRLNLSDGPDNRVQFRGLDLAGNGPATSDEYIVRVDTTPPSIEPVDPVPGVRLTDGTVVVTVSIHDNTSGVDPDTLLVRFDPSGPGDWTEWVTMRGAFEGTRFVAEAEMVFEPGEGNLVQVRVSDVASNVGLSSVMSFWVNRPPVAAISSPMEGGTFSSVRPVLFSASGSSDPDGDLLAITWSLEGEVILGFEGDDVEQRLGPGSYLVTATVEDGFGGTDQAIVIFTVEEREVSSWTDDWWWLLLFILFVTTVLVSAYLVVLRQRVAGGTDDVERETP